MKQASSTLQMELKAYKMLAQLRGQMLSTIEHKARNEMEYGDGTAEKPRNLLQNIADPGKWDYCGIISNEDKKVIETLEYLLRDEQDEIRPYKSWQPPQR